MNKSVLIAFRELKERIGNRSFKLMLFIGPLLIVSMIYLLLESGNQGVTSMKVLISDPTNLFENKIAARTTEGVTYYFYEDYIEFDAFKNSPKFQEFDALIELNEKVLINKKVFLFHREEPNLQLKMKLKFEIERRMEEVLIEQFTSLEVDEFRKIKQPLNIDFRNVDDPYSQADNGVAWIGYFLGYIMIFFIAIFGTNITKSINREKMNRISEVILASVKSRQLMLGKIFGNLLASFLQLFAWIVLVALGLWVLQSLIIPEFFTPEHLTGVQVSDQQLKDLGMQTMTQENMPMDLVFHRVNYWWLIPNFILFFLGTYWIFASFFTIMGAMSGDESDGQQFLVPIWILLSLTIFAGYNTLSYPDSGLTTFFSFFPWTSGMVSMIKVTVGVTVTQYLGILFAWLIQVSVGSAFILLAARIFQHGILSYSHRFSLSLFFSWLRK
jgi:ABC-2 type transport system permease protein